MKKTGYDSSGVFARMAKVTLLHPCQMNQVQHLIPVNRMLLSNRLRSILNRLLYELHLLNPILHQLKLDIQRIQHDMTKFS